MQKTGVFVSGGQKCDKPKIAEMRTKAIFAFFPALSDMSSGHSVPFKKIFAGTNSVAGAPFPNQFHPRRTWKGAAVTESIVRPSLYQGDGHCDS